MIRTRLVEFILLVLCTSGSFGQSISESIKTVRIGEEPTVIPTYIVDPSSTSPRFYDGRAYQGAQGRVYPYPINENLSRVKEDKSYQMVYLENEYISRLMFCRK